MAEKGAKLALFFGLCWNHPGYPMSRDMGSALLLASPSTLKSALTIYRKAKMSEVQFSDITIIGNSAAKAPRKEGKTKEGKDQFIITMSLLCYHCQWSEMTRFKSPARLTINCKITWTISSK
jgi:hypothetical protein